MGFVVIFKPKLNGCLSAREMESVRPRTYNLQFKTSHRQPFQIWIEKSFNAFWWIRQFFISPPKSLCQQISDNRTACQPEGSEKGCLNKARVEWFEKALFGCLPPLLTQLHLLSLK